VKSFPTKATYQEALLYKKPKMRTIKKRFFLVFFAVFSTDNGVLGLVGKLV
jgi:hypothetical protein